MNTQNLSRSFLALVLFVACAMPAVAASPEEIRQSFRSVSDVSLSRGLLVPSVVSITLPPDVSGSQAFGVYSVTDDVFLPYEVRRQSSRSVPVRVSNSEGINEVTLRALIDENHATVVDFSLPETGDAGVVTLQYVFSAPITSNSLQMALSQYVVRPTTVSIRAEINEELQTVVARTGVSSNAVSFPTFTSSVWSITLEYAQPLRFTELSFVNTNVVEESTSLVFLGKPNTTYKLYYNPEVILPQETGERPQFASTEGTVSGSLSLRTANSEYQPADSDYDGVPDLSDNCPRVANEDQQDVEGNGRGDACDDFDHDGVQNVTDNCVDTPNRNQADIDRDGLGDECDKEESRLTEKYPWIVWIGLSFAFLVFVGLFFVALRRNEAIKPSTLEATNKEPENPTLTQ